MSTLKCKASYFQRIAGLKDLRSFKEKCLLEISTNKTLRTLVQ